MRPLIWIHCLIIVVLPGCNGETETSASVPTDTVVQFDTLLMAADGVVAEITDMTVDREGTLWLADSGNHRIVAVPPASDRHPIFFGGRGSGPGEFEYPGALSVSDSLVAVFDTGNGRIQWMDMSGAPVRSQLMQQLQAIFPFAMNSAGELVVPNMGRSGGLAEVIRSDPGAPVQCCPGNFRA